MAEPSPDRVDIDRTEEVCGGGVPDGVWADSFCRQGGSFQLSLPRMALDQAVNAKTRDWMAAAIEEDILVRWTIGDQSREFSNGHRPKRTETFFTAFTVDLHTRSGQVQIVDQQLGGFIGTATGVVKEQQQGIVAAALRGLTIGAGQQCVHLWFFQIRNNRLRRLLERDCTKLTTPLNVFRTVFSDESRQSMDSSESLVSRRDSTFARLFQMEQEETDKIGRHVDDGEPVHSPVQLSGHERKQ